MPMTKNVFLYVYSMVISLSAVVEWVQVLSALVGLGTAIVILTQQIKQGTFKRKEIPPGGLNNTSL
jgi:hypothetical protein